MPVRPSASRPILRIPSLAIHLNREVNSKGFEVNSQSHLPPVLASTLKLELNKPSPAAAPTPANAPANTPKLGCSQDLEERHPPRLLRLVADSLGCSPQDIADFDLQLCDTQAAALGGAEREFVFSGRLDNLASCYASLQALLRSCADGSLEDETAVRMARGHTRTHADTRTP